MRIVLFLLMVLANWATAQRSGDLRLVRFGLTSSFYTSGRLEVYYSGRWGTVCDDGWSSTNSRVACRQLGFAGAASPTSFRTASSSVFGTGTGTIWLDDVRCSGTESRLTSCQRNSYGSHNCFHSEDVAIYCNTSTLGCSSTQFRCTSGQCVSTSSRCTGINTCSDRSDEMNCITCSGGAFRCSNRQCILSSDRCDGNRDCTDGSDERNCTSCSSGAFRCNNGQCIRSVNRCDGTRNCTDGSDEAGCPRSGDLRLVRNGISSSSYTRGRLEVYYSGRWGTVCDDFWDSTNTRVACRQLGFSGSTTSWTTSSAGGYGSATGTIWLDNVNCLGTESRLTSCQRNLYGSHNCVHSEDVAIDCRVTGCSSTQFRCTSGQCVSTSSRCTGINTCSDRSDEMNCITCSSGAFRCSNRQCIRSSDRCDGNRDCTDGSDERNCTSCSSGAFRCNNGQCIRSVNRCDGTRNCTDGSDEAGCPRSGDLRLVRNGISSSSYTRGRLEIYYSGRWGTVCDDFWDSTNTRVACRQLGFSGSSTSWTTSNAGGYGSATGTIWLDNVNCFGTESRLTSCSRNSYGSHNCFHSEDVAIDCRVTGCSSTQFRCTSGQCVTTSSRCTGINTCSDGSDQMNCLTCSSGAFRCSNRQCIRSSDRCDGNRDCTDGSDEMNCNYSECLVYRNQVGFPYFSGYCCACTNQLKCPRSGDLRLVRNGISSSSYTRGRLEVYYSGRWGTVCDDLWDSTDTRVACRQLGFSGSSTSWTTSSAGGYGSATGTIWLDNVNCFGTESRLTSCQRNSYGSHNCVHSHDVAIDCSSSGCSSTQFRCTGGQCIFSSSRCNGFRTCSDGSDERNCITCSSGAFRCSNRQCIRSSDRCDGNQDCTDGSDERNCISCSSGAFWCNNGQCIRSVNHCDGTRNCTDGSDETGCNGPRSGDLRLVRNGVSSSSYTRGRLEVYYSGRWGTVCDDFWDSTNTRVACRQLGFSGSSTSWTTSSAGGYGSATGTIWLDNVNCFGTESRLTSCQRNSYGSHNCVHSHDVAIDCSSSGTSIPRASGTSVVGISVGASAGSLVLFVIIPIIICIVIACAVSRSSGRTRTTVTTVPSATPSTTVVTASSQQQSIQQSDFQAYPAAGTIEQAPASPSYEMCTYPSQPHAMYPPQPQTAYF